MARARNKNAPFDFDNATQGSPGPDGSPVIDTFVTDSGIPGVETRSAQGLRTFTFPLAAVRRQPVSRVIPPPPEAAPKRQPARVARMLALAHDLQGKLDRGEYPDQATLAAQLGFTRGRLSKLLDLTLLAPDIQEEVLHLDVVDGEEPLAERALREIAAAREWAEQRRRWYPHGESVSGEVGAGRGAVGRCMSLNSSAL
jgi:hypothetical protein